VPAAAGVVAEQTRPRVEIVGLLLQRALQFFRVGGCERVALLHQPVDAVLHENTFVEPEEEVPETSQLKTRVTDKAERWQGRWLCPC
jgi:hypothetical protein